MRKTFQEGLVHGYQYPTTGDAPYALLIVHGIGGHGGTYDVFCEPLSKRGVQIVSMDLPGHGLARCRDNQRGNWRFEEWLEDIDIAAKTMKNLFGKPVFILGSSLGSAAAFHSLAYSDSLTGGVCMNVILTNVEPKKNDPVYQHYARWRSEEILLLANKAGDTERIDLSTAIDWNKNYGSNDSDILGKKRQDNLRTWSYGVASLASYWNYQPEKPESENEKPVLLTYGDEDPFISSNYMERCYAAIGGPKSMSVVKGGSHQLMLYHTEEYIDVVDKWILQQIT